MGGRSPAQVGETELGSWGGSVGGERHCSDRSGVRGDREGRLSGQRAPWAEEAEGWSAEVRSAVRREFSSGGERAHEESVAGPVQQQVLVTLGDGLSSRALVLPCPLCGC